MSIVKVFRDQGIGIHGGIGLSYTMEIHFSHKDARVFLTHDAVGTESREQLLDRIRHALEAVQ